MIGFELTAKQEEWRQKARDFAEKEIRPIAVEAERNPETIRWDILKKLARNGFLSLFFPQEYGGYGLDALTSAIVIEEMTAGDVAIGFHAAASYLPILLWAGTEEQKRKFIPILCDKEDPKLGAFAINEPNAGSDSAAMSTTAKLEDSEYVLNGTKNFITNAGLASFYLVGAYTDKTKGSHGMSIFIVPSDAPGLSIGKVEDKMGLRFSHQADLILNNARVPKDNLLGQEGEGFRLAMQELDFVRPLNTGAVSVGLARAAYETALRFAKETVQFGEPAFAQQSISFMLTDMLALIEATRLLVWKTCWLIDNNLPYTIESAMIKFFASDMAMKVTTDAVQILGLDGYRKESPVEKYMRDAKILQIYVGTNQIQRIVASRRL